MSDFHFDRLRVALFDPAYMNRQSTLGALQTLGIKDVEPVGRAADLEQLLGRGAIDIIFAELQGQRDQICAIVRQLRHRAVGPDPFLGIILTTWSLDSDTVRDVVNSGADDLLARPCTIAQLRQRIVGIALNRKPFVVTADYVGPSRRTSTRPPEEDELFEVPNTVRARLIAGLPEPGPEAIGEAWNRVLRWKALRLGRQLEASARMLNETALSAGNEPAIASMVERIVGIAKDIHSYVRQADDPEYHVAAGESQALAKSVRVVPGMAEAEKQRVQSAARSLADRVRRLRVPRGSVIATAPVAAPVEPPTPQAEPQGSVFMV